MAQAPHPDPEVVARDRSLHAVQARLAQMAPLIGVVVSPADMLRPAVQALRNNKGLRALCNTYLELVQEKLDLLQQPQQEANLERVRTFRSCHLLALTRVLEVFFLFPLPAGFHARYAQARFLTRMFAQCIVLLLRFSVAWDEEHALVDVPEGNAAALNAAALNAIHDDFEQHLELAAQLLDGVDNIGLPAWQNLLHGFFQQVRVMQFDGAGGGLYGLSSPTGDLVYIQRDVLEGHTVDPYSLRRVLRHELGHNLSRYYQLHLQRLPAQEPEQVARRVSSIVHPIPLVHGRVVEAGYKVDALFNVGLNDILNEDVEQVYLGPFSGWLDRLHFL